MHVYHTRFIWMAHHRPSHLDEETSVPVWDHAVVTGVVRSQQMSPTEITASLFYPLKTCLPSKNNHMECTCCCTTFVNSKYKGKKLIFEKISRLFLFHGNIITTTHHCLKIWLKVEKLNLWFTQQWYRPDNSSKTTHICCRANLLFWFFIFRLLGIQIVFKQYACIINKQGMVMPGRTNPFSYLQQIHGNWRYHKYSSGPEAQ
jgi:hypothetical protein